MAVGKTSDASFETDVLKSAEPVVVDFWAEWCGPCKQMDPFLQKIKKELENIANNNTVLMDWNEAKKQMKL